MINYDNLCFQGVSIKPWVKLLHVKTGEKHKPNMNEKVHSRVRRITIFFSSLINVFVKYTLVGRIHVH